MTATHERPDPFEGFPLQRIHARAAQAGLALDPDACSALATQARAVLSEPELHLTSIRDPEVFLERHLGEAFEGASLLDTSVTGLHVDLGSGNGYPALPVMAARRGLRALLTEASQSKADFLDRLICNAGFMRASVLAQQVQRAGDLPGDEPVRVLTCRAMGAWQKVVPRLAARLTSDAQVLVWCGKELEEVARREVWRRLRVECCHALPGRDQSFVWLLRPAPR